MLTTNKINDIFSELPDSKKIILESFINELQNNEKYKKLRTELTQRRDEINTGKKLSEEEFWNGI